MYSTGASCELSCSVLNDEVWIGSRFCYWYLLQPWVDSSTLRDNSLNYISISQIFDWGVLCWVGILVCTASYISKVIYHDHCRDQQCQFLWQMTSTYRNLKWPIFLEIHDHVLKNGNGAKMHVGTTEFIWVPTQTPYANMAVVYAPIGIRVLSKVGSGNMPQNQWHMLCTWFCTKTHVPICAPRCARWEFVIRGLHMHIIGAIYAQASVYAYSCT